MFYNNKLHLHFPSGRIPWTISWSPARIAVPHFDWFLGLYINVWNVEGILTLLWVHKSKLKMFDKFCWQLCSGLTWWPGPRPLAPLVPSERVDQLWLGLCPGVDVAGLPDGGLTDGPGAPALPALDVPPLLVSLHQFVAAGPLPPPVVLPCWGPPTLRLAAAVSVPVSVPVSPASQTHSTGLALIVWSPPPWAALPVGGLRLQLRSSPGLVAVHWPSLASKQSAALEVLERPQWEVASIVSPRQQAGVHHLRRQRLHGRPW